MKKWIFILAIILGIPLLSAQFGYDNENLPRILPLEQSPIITYGDIISNLTSQNQNLWIFDNFFNCQTGSAISGDTGWSQNAGGAQQSNSQCVSGGQYHDSVQVIDTGTSAASQLGKNLNKNILGISIIGNEVFEYSVLVANSTPANTTGNTLSYSMYYGLMDAVQPVDGIYFYYDVNSINNRSNWSLMTSSNSVRTQLNTSIAVSNSTWYNLKSVVNSSGTNVTFYINNVIVGSINNTIPNSLGREAGLFWGANISEVPGTRVLLGGVDWVRFTRIINETRL